MYSRQHAPQRVGRREGGREGQRDSCNYIAGNNVTGHLAQRYTFRGCLVAL